ncbi:unnamed protein product [Owenia fusiformis]|uniref:Uncharacterized protein n=1 Tax=Owenia fusiformis TaxID=6347 RepID=A0A8S4P2A4_OWEFU|nr:unnamed protein product [Owenia fusiformis]
MSHLTIGIFVLGAIFGISELGLFSIAAPQFGNIVGHGGGGGLGDYGKGLDLSFLYPPEFYFFHEVTPGPKPPEEEGARGARRRGGRRRGRRRGRSINGVALPDRNTMS